MKRWSIEVGPAPPGTETAPSTEEAPRRRRKFPVPETIPQGTYCEQHLAPRKNFVEASLTWTRKGQNWVAKGCPLGEWRPRRKWVDKNGVEHIGKCSRAMQVYIIRIPKRPNRKCPIGTRRFVQP